MRLCCLAAGLAALQPLFAEQLTARWRMRPRTLQDIAAAGIAVTCVSSFSDAAPAFKPLPPGAQPSGAIVSLQLSGAAPAVGTALLLAQLLAAAPAGVAFAMITVDGGRNNWVSRAALVRPAGWPSPGQKQIFVQQTSEFLDAFNKIYSQKLWSAAGGGSGVGSTHAYTGAQPAPHGTVWGRRGACHMPACLQPLCSRLLPPLHAPATAHATAHAAACSNTATVVTPPPACSRGAQAAARHHQALQRQLHA